jgi:diguanylate cyclase (GGDEF)-like protein
MKVRHMRTFRIGMSLLARFAAEEVRRDRLRCLLFPQAHPRLVGNRRNRLILSRIHAVAAGFALLTLAWLPIDLIALPMRDGAILAVLRVAAAAGFAILVLITRRRQSLARVYVCLVLLYAIPTVFYFTSLILLHKPGLGIYARTALEAYWALPAVAMAGLGIFPLTLLESVAFSLPIIAGEAVAFALHLGVFFPGGAIDAIWMMFLMGGIAATVGLSQLSFSLTLVGQSLRDGLTGCYARASISELIELSFQESRHCGTPIAIAFLDLDHFKEINDLHGHEFGDQVLIETVRRIGSMLRATESLGRWGGEEFVVVLPGSTGADAVQLIQRIRARGLGRRPGGKAVTVSVGVAERIADQCDDWLSLVRLADQRMYAMKNAGRDRVCGPQDFGAVSRLTALSS